MKQVWGLIGMLCLSGCYREYKPSDYDHNICQVVQGQGWSKALHRAANDHQISPGLVLSVIYHESSFKHDARPKPYKILGLIPWRRSSSYGYGQIKDETWEWYKSHNPGWFQSRTHFSDTVDFIGWYYKIFKRKSENHDAHNFYLAYHEGLGGYQRKTYEGNDWLLNKANMVSERAKYYDEVLLDCL